MKNKNGLSGAMKKFCINEFLPEVLLRGLINK